MSATRSGDRSVPRASTVFGWLARLQADALVTVDPDLAAKAEGLVRIAPLRALLTGE